MIIKLAVTFAVFCALLWLLNRAMPEFHIELGAIPVAALILVGVNYLVGILFGGADSVLTVISLGLFALIKKIINIVTFGLFGLIVSFVLNVIIFWLADKLTDRFTIKSFKTLLMSAAALQFANYLIGKFV
jgi:uncharacterized membrane protein YvlD (DUF360 family)